MSTADDLIIETQGLLRSWNLNAEQMTTLTSTIGSTDLTFNVSDTQSVVLGMSSGIVEIGEELVYVQSVSDTGVCVVPTWGRGYLGTTAASHVTGDRITSQPVFPRRKVLDAINESLGRVYPELYAVKSAAFTTDAVKVTYDLPDDAVTVLDARWLEASAQKYWRGIRKMRVNPASGVSGDGAVGPYTNVTVDISDQMTPGQPLVITYTAIPTRLTSASDNYTVTGLPASSTDVLVLGAAAKLTVSQELSRLQLSSIEQQNRSQLVAPSAALTSSRYLEQEFQLRLKEEALALRAKYPVRVMGVWI